MKVCITAQGKSLDSFVDPRFGRAMNLIVVDSKKPKKILKLVENSNIQAMHGAGVATAQTVAQEGCKGVITGNIGPNAFMVLNQAGIKVYSGAFGMTIHEALKKLKKGELPETTEPTVGGHFGGGLGRGPGGGLGRRGRSREPRGSGRGGRGFRPPQ